MMIAEITQEHKNQLDEQEAKFEAEIARREENERRLRDEVQRLSAENAEQKKELEERRALIRHLQEEINRNQSVHE